jgi:hypothetical protein
MIIPIVVQLQIDGWTDRLVLPRDYLRLSTVERRVIPLRELRYFLPRELEYVSDWAVKGLLTASMLPGFNPHILTVGSGSGYQNKTVIFLTNTGHHDWKVIDDWNNEDNFVECIGQGAHGTAGRAGADLTGGRGGQGGAGGAWAKKSLLEIDPIATPTVPYVVGTGNGAGGTWFIDDELLYAAGANGRVGGNPGACRGDVSKGGGDGGLLAEGGNGYTLTRVILGVTYIDYYGGGAGGAGGGGGAAGPSIVGAPGFNGGPGGNAEGPHRGPGGKQGGGGAGGNSEDGQGGRPGNGSGAHGDMGDTWNASHGTGGGGAGGAGGKGGHASNYDGPQKGAKGDNGGNGAKYGAGGGGGGGGGGCWGPNGALGEGQQGMIVITNNSTVTT